MLFSPVGEGAPRLSVEVPVRDLPVPMGDLKLG